MAREPGAARTGGASGSSGARVRPHTRLGDSGRAGTRPFRFGLEVEPDPDPPLSPGTELGGRYRISQLLGEGGMGRVYEAQHTHLARKVALKLLRRDAQADPETVARFEQEALAASRIGHENIVEILDFARLDDGRVYMVMELLEGQSMEDWLDHRGTLDVAIPWLVELCDGLHAAHKAGVIHRDIKPANVFIRSKPDVSGKRTKVLDFGIAKMTSRKVDGFETQAGSVLGTPYYLAPERIMNRSLGPEADLYSVGVILYELLTGTVPFVEETFMAILAHHVKTPPLDPRQAAPDRPVPDGLAALCMRLLAKEPSDRPATADEVATTLRNLLVREGAQYSALVTGIREEGGLVGDSTIVLDDAGQSVPGRSTAVPGHAVGPMTSFADGHRRGAAAREREVLPDAEYGTPPRGNVGVYASLFALLIAVAGVAFYWTATRGGQDGAKEDAPAVAGVPAPTEAPDSDSPSPATVVGAERHPDPDRDRDRDPEPEPDQAPQPNSASVVDPSTALPQGTPDGTPSAGSTSSSVPEKKKKNHKQTKQATKAKTKGSGKPSPAVDEKKPPSGPTIKSDVYEDE